jgi:phosphoribosylformylglycinamidine cyclo-ligase
MSGRAPSNPSGGDRAGLSYRAAGVDIDAGDALVDRIKPLAARTRRAGVLGGIGGFGALFQLPAGMREPVLVSGTDGVGTKLKLAFLLDRHDTIGIDLVAMSANDILVQGAEPLYFLDYFACGRLDVPVAAAVVGGIAAGCEQAGCALIGGETAEMPGMYRAGEYDLAGFAVGVVERKRLIDGSTIAVGDRVLGVASSGPHSNGYSLIRRVIDRVCGAGRAVGDDVGDDLGNGAGDLGVGGAAGGGAENEAAARRLLAEPLAGRPLADWLMAPTRLYVKSLLPLFADPARPIKGLAHITGGGLVENVPRILPPGCQAVLRRTGWPRPAVFDWLQREGAIAEAEMARVFNCGIGMVVVVAAAQADPVAAALRAAGETVHAIGEIRARDPSAAATVIV